MAFSYTHKSRTHAFLSLLNFRLERQNKTDGVWLVARSGVIFMGINPPGKNIKSENGKPEDKLLNIWSFTVLNEIIKPIFNNLLLPLPLKHALLCLLVWFWHYVETRPIARSNPSVGRHAFFLRKNFTDALMCASVTVTVRYEACRLMCTRMWDICLLLPRHFYLFQFSFIYIAPAHSSDPMVWYIVRQFEF